MTAESELNSIKDLVSKADNKGYIQKIVDLTGAQNWFNGIKAIAKVTATFATILDKFVYNDNIKKY